MKNCNEKVMKSFVLGAAIGASLGILYAPYKGSKTRKKIKGSAVDAKDDVSKFLKNSKDELTKTAHETKEAFEGKLEEVISSLSFKAENIINSLEDKLEDLKKKNAEHQK